MAIPKKFEIIKLSKARRTIKNMKVIAVIRGGKCLSKRYINNRTQLRWQCKRGHIWKATPTHIISGEWCPKCSGNIKKTIKDMQILAKKMGGKCLSKRYVNNKTKLKWQCKKGHTWKAIPSNIVRFHWCPRCRSKRIT